MLVDALHWLGHSGFRLDAGRATVYIDPYRVGGGPPADVILITHGHYDHFSPLAIEQLSKRDTRVVAPASVAERLEGRVTSIGPGERLEDELTHGVEVLALPAYNTSKRDPSGDAFHPREAGWVGYEVRVGGERIYHSGDTDVIPEMDEVVGVDVALLPVSGVYVMTAAEAVEAARRIEPLVAVPMHWGDHLGTYDDAATFAESAPVPVRIMERTG